MDLLTTVSVTSAAYPTDPQVDLGWEPDSLLIAVTNTVATNLIYVSFDGVKDDGLLRPGITGAVAWNSKRPQVWLRLGPAAANPTSVDVMASTVR